MRTALGTPQTVALLGGTSEIGTAIIDRLIASGARTVKLAGRDGDALERTAARLRADGADIEIHEWDARDRNSGVRVAADLTASGDLDVAILAAGLLGDETAIEAAPALIADLIDVNFAGPAVAGVALLGAMGAQGHGLLVVLSSVAAERPRAANAAYGATKAALDALFNGLGDRFEDSGASVLVVRLGFVSTRMTEGMKPAPFAITPAQAATAVTSAILEQRAGTIWVPTVLRYVMFALRHLPRRIFVALAARG